VTLDEFLDRFAEILPERDGFVVPCPSHSDSRPSLRVAVGGTGKVILRCRAGCETAKVVSDMGLTFADLSGMDTSSTTRRASSLDVPASPADVARLAVSLDTWSKALATDAGTEAREYAARRFGLSASDIERLGLGYAADLGGAPRLVVPFRDRDGVARGFQARALSSDAAVRWYGPKSPEGASWAKVGFFPGGSGWDEVLICEGPGDSLTANALGYDAIGIRGAALASNQRVVEQVVEIVGDRVAVVAGDGDPSGQAFSSMLARSLAAAGVRVKILPVPPGLDLTEWREREKDSFARECVRQIVSTEIIGSFVATLRMRDEIEYPLTDLGNARFVRDYISGKGSGVRYSPEGGFFLLDAGVWRADRLDRVRAFVQETADQIANIARNLTIEAGTDQAAGEVARRWRTWAKHSQSRSGIDSAVREIQALRDVACDLNDFDRFPHLLACRNGVINLKTGGLLPHDPALLLTRRIDLDYDPNAKAPRWERFLTEVFHKYADLPAYIQRLIGYGISGETAEQAFAVLWGTGANGKSVFTDTLTEVFREITVTTPFATFEEKQSGGIPNDLAALKGARLVMASEGEAGKPMAEAILKRVTGRDLISARFMRREFFEFRPQFLLLLATNFKPQFKGQDEGLWRRVKLVPWERYFAPEERDHRLGDVLRGEAAGILAWAVRGAVDWYEGGLRDPDVIRNSTREYRATSDGLAGFLPGIFVRDDKERKLVDGSLLYNAYLTWADEENLPQKERWTRRAFFAALEERGMVKRRSAKGFAFAGVRRVTQAEIQERIEEAADTTETEPVPTQVINPITSGPSLDDVI
jgi:putative DNA primase/helicase